MPAPTSDSVSAKYSEAIVQMVADVAAFRTLVGAANATAAKSYILEDAGGDLADSAKSTNDTAIDCTTASFAVVRLLELRRVERNALMTYGREGEAEVDLIIRPTTGDSDPAAFRRARNTVGDIADGIQDLFGTGAARICWGFVSEPSPLKTDEIRVLRGAFVSRLSLQFRDIP